MCFALLLRSPIAMAQGDTSQGALSAQATPNDFTRSPPYAPFRPGPLAEGSLGVYAPTGLIKKLSAPGPFIRVAVGFDVARWLGVYVGMDAAFLATNRAPEPPTERGYPLWGGALGARFSFGISDRFRIPLRLELGFHKTDDAGVLRTYGFTKADALSLSTGASTGLEWRAPTRHFGIAAEIGVRDDTGLEYDVRAQAPIAIISAIIIRYTL
ncbi:MAG: hypothetical protein NVS3B20_23220 [Polyangiales bacterium]